MKRSIGASLILAGLMVPAASQAQIFLKAPPVAGGPLLAPETGYGLPLPGATPAENRAALVWNLRSAMNVAALQCGNEPFSRIAETYNVMIANHRDELSSAFNTLTAYFKRRNKSAAAAQKAIDTYGTRTYSSYSAVAGLKPFCHVSGRIVRDAIFAPRTKLFTVAESRLREVHNALGTRRGEQQFPGIRVDGPWRLPKLDDGCWREKKRKITYNLACGYSYAS